MVECQLPKLDVASSTLVSRSIFSTTYKNQFHSVLRLCCVYMISAASNCSTVPFLCSTDIRV